MMWMKRWRVFMKGAITYTGPIFGPKMKPAADQAARYEAMILAAFDLDLDAFKRLRSPGSRRRAVLRIDDLAIRKEEAGLQFTFTLPRGAYATMVMREFMRNAK